MIMLKVAITIPTIKSGGAEKQATLLASVLSNLCEVHFISVSGYSNAAQSNIAILKNAPGHVILHSLEGNIIKRILGLRKILRDNSIDTVFNYLSYCDIICGVTEKIVGVRNIYGGIRNSQLPYGKYLLEKVVHNYISTLTIFNCYSGLEYFVERGFKKEKSIVIPNCFTNISAPMFRLDKKVKKIITVGRFVQQKDYLTAIKTIATLRKRTTDFHFMIVGYGELEEVIRQWVSKYEITDFTEILITPSNIPELLYEADLYLSTSLYEGTSNSIMEALNWSLPVVCTNVGDNSYLIQNNINGFLHKVGDYEGMAHSLSLLIDNANMRQTLGTKGNTLLHNQYSLETFSERYNQLLSI